MRVSTIRALYPIWSVRFNNRTPASINWNKRSPPAVRIKVTVWSTALIRAALLAMTHCVCIAPNPTSEGTIVTYSVAKAGHISLQVVTEDGRPLKTLREEEAQAGTFTYEWDTYNLTPGTYLCVLSLDGNVLVKKLVKVEGR